MEMIQSTILYKLLWPVMPTVIVSLMLMIWLPIQRVLMPSGLTKVGSVVEKKMVSIALRCGHQRLKKLNWFSISQQSRMHQFGRPFRWREVNKSPVIILRIHMVFGYWIFLGTWVAWLTSTVFNLNTKPNWREIHIALQQQQMESDQLFFQQQIVSLIGDSMEEQMRLLGA